MLITDCQGNWLEKELKTSPEDTFIRSEVTYKEGDKEKSFYFLYVGYFEEAILEKANQTDPLFNISGKEVHLRDVTALIAFVQHPEFKSQKRVYIHDQEDLNKYFEQVDFNKLKEAVTTLLSQGKVQLDHLAFSLNETRVG